MAGGMLNRNSELDQPLAEINVTPLVDVMLVLLVIFIITAPLMAQALKLNLPRVEAATDGETIVINLTIDSEGTLELDGEVVTEKILPTLLVKQLQQKPEAVLRLGGDADTPYAHIATLLALVQHSGIQRIAFATAPPVN